MSKPDVEYDIGLNSKKFDAGIKSIDEAFSRMQGNVVKAAAGYITLSKSIDLATASTEKIVSETGQLEAATVKWEVLTGSVEEAHKNIKHIFEFSNRTPFTFKSVEQAASVLYNLTDGALHGEGALKLLGDRAAKANQPIEEISVWFGRLYSNMQAGRPIGEAMARMQELGIVSGTLRNELEDMSKSDMMNGTAWQRFIEGTENADGMMERLSQTIKGKLSTLEGVWDGIFAFDDKEMQDSIKGSIDTMINALTENKSTIQDILKDTFSVITDITTGAMLTLIELYETLNPGKGIMKSGAHQASSMAAQFGKASVGKQQEQYFAELAKKEELTSEAMSTMKDWFDTALAKGEISPEELKAAIEKSDYDTITKAISYFDRESKNTLGRLDSTNVIAGNQNEILRDLVVSMQTIEAYNKVKATGGSAASVDNGMNGFKGETTGAGDEVDLMNDKAVQAYQFALTDIALSTRIATEAYKENMDKIGNTITLTEVEYIHETTIHYDAMESILIGANNSIINIHEAFSKQSLSIFSKGMSGLSYTVQNMLKQLNNSGLTSIGKGVLGGLGVAGATFGLVSTIAGLFEGDDTSENESTYSSTGTTARADIVSSGPENVYVTNNFSINSSYIGDEVGTQAFFDEQIAPRIVLASSGVL